jgi:hypothetical protein
MLKGNKKLKKKQKCDFKSFPFSIPSSPQSTPRKKSYLFSVEIAMKRVPGEQARG